MALHMGLLFILGICIFGGMFGGYLFQKARIPQVVGYIAIGLLIGQSGFQIITAAEIVSVGSINLFALGVIGFLVGGELELESFRKYGKQFSAILLSEGIAAFLLVGLTTFFVFYFAAHLSLAAAIGSAIVFGAIASATDPASTINVLWENKASGILTLSLTAIVALDDALAMALYGFGTTAAQMIISGDGSVLLQLRSVVIELGGAILTGSLLALILAGTLKLIHEVEKVSVVAIGLVFLVVSISDSLGMDIILASMVFGFGTRNLAPYRSKTLFEFLQGISVAIYVLFFVFVGARIELNAMPLWLWGIVGLYVVFRTLGKWGGAMLGAKLSGSDPKVKKYLGMGLFSQGGVAIGLSIMASQHLDHIQVTPAASLGDLIVSGITATTLIVQLLGPPFVKLALSRAGEQNRRITEDDVIARMQLQELIRTDAPLLYQGMPLADAITIFSQSELEVLAVVNEHHEVEGVFTLESFKQVLSQKDSWAWLLVSDTMFPIRRHSTIPSDTSASDAYHELQETHLDYLVVVAREAPRKLTGLIEIRTVKNAIKQHMLQAG